MRTYSKGTARYVGHTPFLNPCLLHISSEFSWTLTENCHKGKREKRLLFQSLCCVLSITGHLQTLLDEVDCLIETPLLRDHSNAGGMQCLSLLVE